MSDELKRIWDRIDDYDEAMVGFQSELVAVPAVGPANSGPGETAKAELVEAWCRRLEPDELFRIDAPDNRVAGGVRPNLAALFKGRGQGRVWVLSHLDIVPPGELSLWDSDPYVLRREGDVIYGRGVEDNQHGLVASYFGMKALRDENVIPGRDVGLIFVADEETGSDYGLGYILENRPDLFSPDDLIIVPDMGLPDGSLIEVAEKSMLWLRFVLTGRQCHASTPDRGINTLRAAAKMITALDEGLPAAFNARDELYTEPMSTFEPTRKDANVPNINTIPGEDVFYFDCRVLPRYDLEDVKAEARRIAEESAAGTGVKVSVETSYQVRAPEPTSPDSPVVVALTEAVAEAAGVKARPQGVGGGTVAAFFRQQGLPVAVWSTIEGNAHAPNESTRISYLKTDAKVFAKIFLGI